MTLGQPGRVHVAGYLVACVVALLASGVWALWPMGNVVLPEYEATSEEELFPPLESAETPVQTSLNAAAFEKQIWPLREPVATPEPVAEVKPPVPASVPQAKVNIQLLAIMEGQEPAAAVYDPASDRVLVLRAGDQVGLWTVRSVRESAMEIVHGERIEELRLHRSGGDVGERP